MSYRFSRPSATEPVWHELFVGLYPERQVWAPLHRLATSLRHEHAMDGRVRPPHLFHVTLNHFGRFAAVPGTLVDDVAAALASVCCRPFDVMFDHVAGAEHLVLKGHDGMIGVEMLQERLAAALVRQGLRPRLSPPHLTLIYRAHTQLPPSPVVPIRWRVGEIVLVHSLIGLGRHERLGTWPLGAKAG